MENQEKKFTKELTPEEKEARMGRDFSEIRKQALKGIEEGLADIPSEEWDEYFEDVETQRLAKKKNPEK